MTVKQFNFFVVFVARYIAAQVYRQILAAVEFARDASTAAFDYMLHITVYRRRLIALNYYLGEDFHEADGILWARNADNGFLLTPIPFRIDNRWLARVNSKGLSNKLKFMITSVALDAAINPGRIAWNPPKDKMASIMEESLKKIFERTVEMQALDVI